MKKIKVSTVEGNTMVWYLDGNGFAVVADVTKQWGDWVVKFQGRTITGYSTKAQAVADAKKLLKK